MAKKIMLTKGFRNLEVGDAQRLTIKKVKYDEKYDKISVTFADDNGGTCTENFMLIGKNGKPNDVAFGIFSTIYKCATHDNTEREVDPTEIEGCTIVADVYQQIVKNDEGEETGRYIHVHNFKEDEDAEPAYDPDEDDADDDDDGLFE